MTRFALVLISMLSILACSESNYPQKDLALLDSQIDQVEYDSQINDLGLDLIKDQGIKDQEIADSSNDSISWDANSDQTIETIPSDSGINDSYVFAPCEISFHYAFNNESTVELMGSFNNWSYGIPMTLNNNQWEVTMSFQNGDHILYKFRIDKTTWVSDPTNPNQTQDQDQNSILDVSCPALCLDGGTNSDAGTDGQTTTSFAWEDAVMYFVMLDRFNNGDQTNDSPEANVKPMANWQGGDLQGLIDKLKSGYFTDLGIDVIWITSPVDAPDGRYFGTDGEYYTGYHGYWPTDLTKVDEHLGDTAKLKEMVDEAHKVGIKVIADYVMNHVHENSPTYTTNPTWFWDLDYNGQQCVCGVGCSWDSAPDKYRCWFTSYLPDFNFQAQAARDYSVNNAVNWIKQTGVDGFRLDAVKHIEMSWLTQLRTEVEKIKTPGERFYMVGETYTNDKALLKDYIDPATKLDGQFDFPLRAEVVRILLMRQGSFWDLENFLNSNDGYYGAGSIMGTFMGNHDLPRSIHLAEDTPLWGNWDGGRDRAWVNQPTQPTYARPYERMALAYTFLMTQPGIPLIYYGDEIGMAGAGDPDNRRFMIWQGTNSFQDGLKDHLKKLIQIRKAHPALSRGQRMQRWIDNDVYAYSMATANDVLYVVINRSDSSKTIFIPGTSYTDLISGNTVSAANVVIGSRSSMILK